MDEIDQAQGEEAASLQEALARRRKTLTSCGRCHYCNEAIGGGSLFCTYECAQEFERERSIREKQGR